MSEGETSFNSSLSLNAFAQKKSSSSQFFFVLCRMLSRVMFNHCLSVSLPNLKVQICTKGDKMCCN